MNCLSASVPPNASRELARSAHHLDRPLGGADRAHAVVDAARGRAGPGRSRSRPAAVAEQVGLRHPAVLVADLAVAGAAGRGPSPGSAGPGRSRGCRSGRGSCWRARRDAPSGSVTTIAIARSAPTAPEVNHLWPLITHSSPSSSARVCSVGRVGARDLGLGHREAAADLARRAAAASQRSFCSSVPCSARISMLPVSGAEQLKAIGASDRAAPHLLAEQPVLPVGRARARSARRAGRGSRGPRSWARSRISTQRSADRGRPGRPPRRAPPIASRSFG